MQSRLLLASTKNNHTPSLSMGEGIKIDVMNKIKSKVSVLLTALVLCLAISACGSDSEPDNPNGLYDWDIDKKVINKQSGLFESQIKEVLYDKSEAYVIEQKRQFERCSDKYYTFKYMYKRR